MKKLGRKRVFLLDDDQGIGYAGAVYAATDARRLGLRVVGQGAWRGDARSYRSLARRIARSRADAVVLSGCICANGQRLALDLQAGLGRDVTLIGTDNFAPAVPGLYLSTAGRPAEALPARGRSFDAKLGGGPGLPDQTAAYAAQATEVLLDAIARSNGTRASVTGALLDSRVSDGLVGSFSLDQNGDPVPAAVAIYRVDPGLPQNPRRVVQGLRLVDVIEVPAGLAK